jgi:hypothetical protein
MVPMDESPSVTSLISFYSFLLEACFFIDMIVLYYLPNISITSSN